VIWKSCVVTFVICLGTAMGVYLVPQLLDVSGDGYGFGAGPTTIGFILLPGAVAATLAGPVGGIGERRFGPRAVVTTATVIMAAALLALSAVHGEIWHIVVGKGLISLANGLCSAARSSPPEPPPGPTSRPNPPSPPASSSQAS
jgi:predicted MFS family arabinose efflux permease